ncbi:MAG: N-acetyltransferase family protein [Roseinatronobacter sp.]
MLTLRDATADDAPAIADIWNPIIRDTVITFHPDPRSPQDIAQMIATRQQAGRAFLVAHQGPVCLGFASYDQFRPGPGNARSMEHTINLAPEARGQGIGHRLLRALEDHARGAGHHLMVAAITGDNLTSIHFHAAQGYVETGRMPQIGWKFGRYHDLVLMQKFLDPR